MAEYTISGKSLLLNGLPRLGVWRFDLPRDGYLPSPGEVRWGVTDFTTDETGEVTADLEATTGDEHYIATFIPADSKQRIVQRTFQLTDNMSIDEVLGAAEWVPVGPSQVALAEAAKVAAEAARDAAVAAAETATAPTDEMVAGLIPGSSGSATAAALSATYVAKAAAAGSDPMGDTALLQAALDSIPSDGGWLVLPAGEYNITAGGLTCDKPVKITGAGSGSFVERGGTRLICTSPTANLLTLTHPGATIQDIAFINESATRPTAGAGLRATHFDHARVERCMFAGFWRGIEIVGGYFYVIRDCAFLRPVDIGLYMANLLAGQMDYGDQLVEGCYFSKYGDPVYGATAIRWEAGGGLRVTSCKTNSGPFPEYPAGEFWENGIVVQMKAGATSVFLVTGSSIEGWKKDGIHVGGAAGSTFGKMTITGNEFLASGGGGACVTIDGAGTTSLDNVVISANVGYGSGGGATLKNINKAVVTGNNFADCALGALNLTNVKNLVQRDNMFRSAINDNDGYLTTAGQTRGVWRYAHEVSALTTNAVYGKIGPGQYAAGVLTVKVIGNVATVGAVHIEQRRQMTRVLTATTVGAAVGTDLAFGLAAAELALTFVADGVGYVRPTVTSVNGKAFTGSVEVEYDGKISQIGYVG